MMNCLMAQTIYSKHLGLWPVMQQLVPSHLVPHHIWSPRPSVTNYVAIDGPHGPSMAAMDGLLYHKWSRVASRFRVEKYVAGNTARSR